MSLTYTKNRVDAISDFGIMRANKTSGTIRVYIDLDHFE